jgi:hypothetical protein
VQNHGVTDGPAPVPDFHRHNGDDCRIHAGLIRHRSGKRFPRAAAFFYYTPILSAGFVVLAFLCRIVDTKKTLASSLGHIHYNN